MSPKVCVGVNGRMKLNLLSHIRLHYYLDSPNFCLGILFHYAYIACIKKYSQHINLVNRLNTAATDSFTHLIKRMCAMYAHVHWPMLMT